MMGDKIEAKRSAKALGLPVVPGSEGIDRGPRVRAAPQLTISAIR